MKRLVPLLLTVLFVVLGHVLGSCAQPQQPTLDVTPPTATLAAGSSLQLTVTRHFANGPVEQVTTHVTYLSSNKNVATVSPRGLVTAGPEAGSATIRIVDAANDAMAVASLTVTPARIEAIDVVPSALVLQPGASQTLTATARMSDGTTKDVTSQVLWSSSNVAAATVGVTAPDSGRVAAIAHGQTTITATDAATQLQGSTIVFVSGEPAKLLAIVVSPNPAVVPAGQKLQLGAVGLYDDGSRKDLTSTVTWSSSVEAAATVDTSGLATGVAAGDTTVTAAAPDGSVMGSAAMKVQ